MPASPDPSIARRRLARGDRRRQLLDVAWRLVQAEGADALTLGRVAEAAGVARPVAYDHFGDREGLLAALYQEFDARQTAAVDGLLEAAGADLQERSRVLADVYLACFIAQGREIPAVIAALAASPALLAVKRACETAFMERCREALLPGVEARTALPGLRAMLGAAEALAAAVTEGELDLDAARDELCATILAMAERHGSTLQARQA